MYFNYISKILNGLLIKKEFLAEITSLNIFKGILKIKYNTFNICILVCLQKIMIRFNGFFLFKIKILIITYNK